MCPKETPSIIHKAPTGSGKAADQPKTISRTVVSQPTTSFQQDGRWIQQNWIHMWTPGAWGRQKCCSCGDWKKKLTAVDGLPLFPRILAIQRDSSGFNRNPILFPMNERSCPVFRPKNDDPRLRSTSQSKTGWKQNDLKPPIRVSLQLLKTWDILKSILKIWTESQHLRHHLYLEGSELRSNRSSSAKRFPWASSASGALVSVWKYSSRCSRCAASASLKLGPPYCAPYLAGVKWKWKWIRWHLPWPNHESPTSMRWCLPMSIKTIFGFLLNLQDDPKMIPQELQESKGQVQSRPIFLHLQHIDQHKGAICQRTRVTSHGLHPAIRTAGAVGDGAIQLNALPLAVGLYVDPNELPCGPMELRKVDGVTIKSFVDDHCIMSSRVVVDVFIPAKIPLSHCSSNGAISIFWDQANTPCRPNKCSEIHFGMRVGIRPGLQRQKRIRNIVRQGRLTLHAALRRGTAEARKGVVWDQQREAHGRIATLAEDAL